ncbi:MAG: BtpA/SgcQ family protein [Thermoflexales bacterium]
MAATQELKLPRIIAAIHLLPSRESLRPDGQPLSRIIEHALLHAHIAWDGGVRAFYFQDVNDVPVAPQVMEHTIAHMTAVGKELRRAFPDAVLGVCLMQNSGKESLQIAHAVDAQFVRIKVYVGAMLKAEGIVQGCAYEAIRTRHHLNAEHIRIFADVYDRLGEPIAPIPLKEMCRQAVEFGRADGIILTGRTPEQSIRMLDEVRPLRLPVPLLVGGGVSPQTLKYFVGRADHFIVHAAFVRRGLPARNGVPVEWDVELVRELVAMVA